MAAVDDGAFADAVDDDFIVNDDTDLSSDSDDVSGDEELLVAPSDSAKSSETIDAGDQLLTLHQQYEVDADGVLDDEGLVEDDEDDDEEEESHYCDPRPGHVRLRPSHFRGIPPTVFVEYPPELRIKRDDLQREEPLNGRRLCYKSAWERHCIRNAFQRAGFSKSEKYWTCLWSKHQNIAQMRELNCLQKINHFPASWCIGRKDRLNRTMNMMKRIHGAAYDFHPETFVLPGERDALLRLLKQEAKTRNLQSSSAKRRSSLTGASSSGKQQSLWIMKPCASSCGKGIKVVNGQQALQTVQSGSKQMRCVVQRYLSKPYLIDGKKFDLRIYVLVAGVDPLRVYIHDEGLTRISTSKYSLKNLSNRFAHLTNYSVNKKAAIFRAASADSSSAGEPSAASGGTGTTTETDNGTAVDPEMEGYKWSLQAFRRWLTQREGKRVMEQTFDKIFDLLLKTMIAAESEITPHLHSMAQYRTNCFELFGCDVILDSRLNPHLLEVNVSPSLMGSSPLDKKIKGTVIADILHLVGTYPYDQQLLRRYTKPSSAAAAAAVAGNGIGKMPADIAAGGEGLRGLLNRRQSSGKHTAAADSGNPFTFSSLSKLMNAQEAYRRNPCPEKVDIAALGNTDSSWLLLLLVEDELRRAQSTRFHVVHPTARNAAYYTTLYRSCRFSDHLIAKWVGNNGSLGPFAKYIPARFSPISETELLQCTARSSMLSSSGAMSFNGIKHVVERAATGRALSAPRSRIVPAEVTTIAPKVTTPSDSIDRDDRTQLKVKQHAHSTSPIRHKGLLASDDASNAVSSNTNQQDATEAENANIMNHMRGHSEPPIRVRKPLMFEDYNTSNSSNNFNHHPDQYVGHQQRQMYVTTNAALLAATLQDPLKDEVVTNAKQTQMTSLQQAVELEIHDREQRLQSMRRQMRLQLRGEKDVSSGSDMKHSTGGSSQQQQRQRTVTIGATIGAANVQKNESYDSLSSMKSRDSEVDGRSGKQKTSLDSKRQGSTSTGSSSTTMNALQLYKGGKVSVNQQIAIDSAARAAYHVRQLDHVRTTAAPSSVTEALRSAVRAQSKLRQHQPSAAVESGHSRSKSSLDADVVIMVPQQRNAPLAPPVEVPPNEQQRSWLAQQRHVHRPTVDATGSHVRLTRSESPAVAAVDRSPLGKRSTSAVRRRLLRQVAAAGRMNDAHVSKTRPPAPDSLWVTPGAHQAASVRFAVTGADNNITNGRTLPVRGVVQHSSSGRSSPVAPPQRDSGFLSARR